LPSAARACGTRLLIGAVVLVNLWGVLWIFQFSSMPTLFGWPGSATSGRTGVELTILMPCLNEAETLAACVRQARKFLADNNVDGEVLVADNGSTDGSRDIAAAGGAPHGAGTSTWLWAACWAASRLRAAGT
jgi:hypothetical protein